MSWRFHSLFYKGDSTRKILDPKRIYTRANLDPNPLEVFENPDKILEKSISNVGNDTYQLYKSISLPAKGFGSIDDVIFDERFEQNLFRSKFGSYLIQVVFDPKYLSPITPRKSSSFSRRYQKLFWDTLSPDLKKELLIPETPKSVQYSTPFVHIPSIPMSRVTPYQAPPPNIPAAMAAIFSPLVLPTQLHDFPQAYSERIKTYGPEGDITTQQDLDRFNDFCDLEEVDYEDAKMRLFAQSFSRDVKKWFKGLTTRSIHNFQEFEAVFSRKWDHKRNSLQLLTQYNNLKIGVNESVQYFSSRFMKTYDSIPAYVKSPPGATKLHYADTFDNEFTLLLRERIYASFEDMMDDAIKVEVNLLASNKTK